MRLLNILIASLLLHQLVAFAESASCLKYEPEVVTISGKLVRETFPGRPNYESIADGDEPETGFYLLPETPICTVAENAINQTAFNDVKKIQLVLNEKQYDELRPKLGTTIRLRGQLFSAFTRHHHANVLLQILN